MPESDGRSQRDRMLAGELYLASDPEIARDARRALLLCERFNRSSADEPEVRQALLAELLGSLGEGVEVRPPLHCDLGYHLHLGAGTFANVGLVALDVAPIHLGDDVLIGPNVQLLTATHPVDAALRRAKWEGSAPIEIGDNAWLGGGAIVLPGVRIGRDTVVGAGAVVVRDLPEGVVAVGNPARVVRSREAP